MGCTSIGAVLGSVCRFDIRVGGLRGEKENATTRRRKGSAKRGGEGSAADVDHAAGGLEEAGLADVVAGLFALDDGANPLGEIVVGGAAVHETGEIVVGLGEEAGADFAVRGEADAAAVAAEGSGDGRDDADFAEAVVEGEAAGGFAEVVGGKLDEGRTALRRATISSMRTTVSGCQLRALGSAGSAVPSSSGIHSMKRMMTPSVREKWAKASTWSSLKPRSRTGVHLHRTEACSLGGANATKHALETAGHPRDAGKGLGVDGVHADGDAGQAGGAERNGDVLQQVTVGGERNVELAFSGLKAGVKPGDLFDQRK